MNAPHLVPFLLLIILIIILAVTGNVRTTLVRDNAWYFRGWVFVTLCIFSMLIMYLSVAWFPYGGSIANKAELVSLVVQLISVAMGFICLGKFFQGAEEE